MWLMCKNTFIIPLGTTEVEYLFEFNIATFFKRSNLNTCVYLIIFIFQAYITLSYLFNSVHQVTKNDPAGDAFNRMTKTKTLSILTIQNAVRTFEDVTSVT